MCHGLVWDKTTCDNSEPTHINYVVFCVEQETETQETGLLHNTYSRIDAQHFYYVSHDTLSFPTFVYFTFFVFPMI